MEKPVRSVAALQEKDTFGFFEDWESNYVTGDRWTPLTADSSDAANLILVGTATGTGGAGGVLQITHDATDNDEIYFFPTKTNHVIANGKSCYCETRMMFTDASDTNNLIFGWISTAAANTLIDNGGGPVASATMAVIYKIDGGTNWVVRSQIGAAVGITTTTTSTDAAPLVYWNLGVLIQPYNATNAWVTYYAGTAGTLLGGEIGAPRNQLRDSSTGQPIVHNLVYTNAAAMGPIVGCKTGAGTAEVVYCDYVAAYQTR